MGLMDKIWDEVFAGSPPSAGPINRKMDLHIDLPGNDSPSSALERTDSSPAPSPSTEGMGRRMSEGGSVRGPSSASQKITINNNLGPQRRPALDTSRSLPTGYRYLPDILSPGSRQKDENVWRSVFNPGAANRNMESLGASKFDKADSKGPSVYDWYNPL